MLYHVFEDSQWTAFYEKSRYVLRLAAQKLLQKNKQKYMHEDSVSKLIWKIEFFVINNGHLNCSYKPVSAEQLL